MAKEMAVVLNPTVYVPPSATAGLAARLHTLRGKRVGVLWNEKPNGDILLDRLEERLDQMFGFSGHLRRTKPSAAQASDEVLNDLAENCDLVINGIGD